MYQAGKTAFTVLQTRFSNPKLGNPVRNGAEWRAGKGDQLCFFVSSEKKIGMGWVKLTYDTTRFLGNKPPFTSCFRVPSGGF